MTWIAGAAALDNAVLAAADRIDAGEGDATLIAEAFWKEIMKPGFTDEDCREDFISKANEQEIHFLEAIRADGKYPAKVRQAANDLLERLRARGTVR